MQLIGRGWGQGQVLHGLPAPHLRYGSKVPSVGQILQLWGSVYVPRLRFVGNLTGVRCCEDFGSHFVVWRCLDSHAWIKVIQVRET